MNRLQVLRGAVVPRSQVAVLGRFRRDFSLLVIEMAQAWWLQWDREREDLIRALLPLADVQLYWFKEGHWYRLDQAIPSFDMPPTGPTKRLADVLFPAKFEVTQSTQVPSTRFDLELVRSEQPRSTTMIRTTLSHLQPWIEQATTYELSQIRACYADQEVCLMGTNLPSIPDAKRYWGQQVWIPLGWEVIPPWSESALLSAAGMVLEDYLLLDRDGYEAIPQAALQPLTRAGVRLLLE